MKRVIVQAFFFFSLFAVCLSIADASGKIDSAKKHLNHANTYYWLSRARGNDMMDIRKNLFHARKAKQILKGLEQTDEVNQLIYQADSIISETEAQMKRASKKIGNSSPLFPSLTGQEQFIGTYSRRDKIAINRSVEGILNIIKLPMFSQLCILIVSDGKDHESEEVARDYVNSHTSHNVITRHGLASFLTKEEMESIYREPIPDEVLKKISGKFSPEGLGILRLFKNDQVDRVSYWGSNFNYWNAKTDKIGGYCCAGGFCESSDPYSPLFFLLILAGFPATWLYNQFNKKFNKDSKGSFAPVWLSPITAIFSLMVVGMSIKGISLMNIDNSTLIMSPKGIGWIAALTLIVGLLPLLLAYIGAARVPQISPRLNNPETVSSIVFGSFLGAFTFLAFTATQRLGFTPSLIIAIPVVVAICIVAMRFGLAYSRSEIANDKASEIEYILLLIALIIYTLFVLIWNFRLIIAASVGLLIFAVIAKYLPDGIIKLKEKIATKTKDSAYAEKKTGIAWLRNEIKEPKFFIRPWEDKFEKTKKFITEDTDEKIEIVFIEADIGCGKTRTAKEIAGQIRKEYEKKGFRATILFGDCDEFSQDADVVPYEPFAQALGDLLGVGRFANPTEKADKLKNGLVGMGLKTVISATGMGALGTLLDAGDEGLVSKTNVKEMATVVAEALTDLSKTKDGKKGKVVFIIDDVQWMDNETFELIKLLFEALREFKDNQVSFIFTSRPDSHRGHEKVKELIKELKKKRVININYDINQKVLKNDEIVEGILENLRFDYTTQQALTGYFRDMGIQRPLHILQTIETLIEKKMIESFADRYVLTKEANLKKLPPPDDFKRMIEELLSGLDPRIISVLQCCAVTGREFRTSTIANIFNMDLLELLRLLKEAEDRHIVEDVTKQDDVFGFVEKRMVGIFRGLKWSSTDDQLIPQQVREYHKRFISVKEREIGIEKDKDTISAAFYRDIISLAIHSNAVRDVYPDKAVHYNRLAAERTYARGMFSAAVHYYNNSIEIIEKEQSKVAPEEMLELYISYARCLLDEQADSKKVAECASKAYEILNKSSFGKDFDRDWAEIELCLIEALIHYRRRQFEDAIIKSDRILKNENASHVQKARAKFYYAISIPLQEVEERRDKHMEVLSEIDKLLETSFTGNDRIEILKVKSEAANNTGFVYLHGLNNPEEAIKFFKMAIELNEMPEIKDQKGIAISHTGLGDAYNKLNKSEKAEQMYKVNLDISQRTGDLQGICMMTSKLGAIKIEEGKISEGNDSKNLFKEAGKLYEKSLATAEDQQNITGICFALAGMLEADIVSGINDWADFVFRKVEEIGKTIDISKAPDFARETLKASLDKLAKASPEHKEKARKYGGEL